MEKTVFISSTYEDLKDYRAKVWEKLNKYQVNIRGMERFGARTEAPLPTCLEEVIQSNIFIGIIGFRLGTVDLTTSKSYVQLEYEKAFDLKKEIFIYLMDGKNSKIAPNFVDIGENHDKLNAFKSILKERHTIDTFTNENDLIDKLGRKFEELLSKRTNNPPIKTDEYQKSQEILKKFLLMPVQYSGKEIKLKIKIKGEPFAASKAICDNFYLTYGNTVGISIKIIEPSVSHDAFGYLFINGNKVDEFLLFGEDIEIDIYASPEFSEATIDNIQATFVSKTYTTYNPDFGLTDVSFLSPRPIKTELIIGEGQIILKLKEISYPKKTDKIIKPSTKKSYKLKKLPK